MVSIGSLLFHPVDVGQIFESILTDEVLCVLSCLAVGLGSVKSKLSLQSLKS